MKNGIEAQFGPNFRHVAWAIRTLRPRRKDIEHPAFDHLSVSEDESREGLDGRRRMIDAMRHFLPRVGSFR